MQMPFYEANEEPEITHPGSVHNGQVLSPQSPPAETIGTCDLCRQALMALPSCISKHRDTGDCGRKADRGADNRIVLQTAPVELETF